MTSPLCLTHNTRAVSHYRESFFSFLNRNHFNQQQKDPIKPKSVRVAELCENITSSPNLPKTTRVVALILVVINQKEGEKVLFFLTSVRKA